MHKQVEVTVKATSSTAKGERAKIKKDRIENELIQACDRELAKINAALDRKAARLARRHAA